MHHGGRGLQGDANGFVRAGTTEIRDEADAAGVVLLDDDRR
jgi:hypothetical protein